MIMRDFNPTWGDRLCYTCKNEHERERHVGKREGLNIINKMITIENKFGLGPYFQICENLGTDFCGDNDDRVYWKGIPIICKECFDKAVKGVDFSEDEETGIRRLFGSYIKKNEPGGKQYEYNKFKELEKGI